MRALRGVAGLVAGGLVALLLALVVAAVVAVQQGEPGPGAVLLVGHSVAAVLAVAAQRHCDRHDGAPAAIAALLVLAVGAAAVVLLWLL